MAMPRKIETLVHPRLARARRWSWLPRQRRRFERLGSEFQSEIVELEKSGKLALDFSVVRRIEHARMRVINPAISMGAFMLRI